MVFKHSKLAKNSLRAVLLAAVIGIFVLPSSAFADDSTTDEAQTAVSSMTTDFTNAKTMVDTYVVPLAEGSIAFGGVAMLIKRFIFA